MTDKQRLLKLAREAEGLATSDGLETRLWIRDGHGHGWQSFNQHASEIETRAAHAGYAARWAAHHALTAMALRDAAEHLP